jgi:serine/threonine-protein kinase RsbW
MSPQIDFLIHHTTLKVASDWDEMATVIQWFDQFNCTALPNLIWVEGQTALIEGFTNAVRHAHRNLIPPPPVELAATISAKCFQICIWDQGDVFDLEAALENLTQKTGDRNFNPLDHEAHWGCIFLLKLRQDYAWSVAYIREQGERNCLLLRKRIVS